MSPEKSAGRMRPVKNIGWLRYTCTFPAAYRKILLDVSQLYSCSLHRFRHAGLRRAPHENDLRTVSIVSF